MRTREPKTPSYRLYKRTGQAVTTIDGKDFYLGTYGTKASRAAYDRLIAEWLAHGRRLAKPGEVAAVSQLILAYVKHSRTYYRKDGAPTPEVAKISNVCRTVKRLYGRLPVDEFTPSKFKAVRQSFIDANLARTTINDAMNIVRRMFKWGVENEIVPPSISHGLAAVAGLRKGRSPARETEPVRPVPDAYVDAIRNYVSPQVWAIIELQRLTGMRSGEVCIMRARDIDMTGTLWEYKPSRHKTQHWGADRIVHLGPRAQEVVKPFLRADLDRYLFDPRDAEETRRQAAENARTTPRSCGNRRGTNRVRKAKRAPGDRYTPASYGRAIKRAIERANADRTKAAQAAGREPELIPAWHPHRLRHSFATRMRKAHGVEITQVLLGQRTLAATQIYAEVDTTRAAAVVGKVG